MGHIRKAAPSDFGRIAEIEIFSYRLNFYPIFRSDPFYFGELQVAPMAERYAADPDGFYVYDDGVVKGFIRLQGDELKKLFVEPVLQGRGIGAELAEFALSQGVRTLWALEKNPRAIRFYERHGFRLTDERRPEEGTDEYLVRMTLVQKV